MLFRQWGVCKCVGLCRSTAFCAEDLPRPTKSPLSTQRRTPTWGTSCAGRCWRGERGFPLTALHTASEARCCMLQ